MGALQEQDMTKLDINPSVEQCELTRLLGGSRSSSFSHGVASRVQRLKGALKGLLSPQLYYRKVRIHSLSNYSVHPEGGSAFKSPKLSKTLKHCESIICFVATIGAAIEKQIKRFTHENRLSDAYILDSMGSVAVESMVEKFHKIMKSKYKAQDKAVTLRFSPGYCDWPVTDQKKLFHLFDSEFAEVKLLDSCLMQPRKSISGVFGLFHTVNPHSPPPYNPCHDCKKTHCIARRTQQAAGPYESIQAS